MKRKFDSIKIDNKEIIVFEMKAKQIFSVILPLIKGGKNLNLSELLQNKEKIINEFFSGITEDELLELAPSQLKEIWKKFREVNADFFAGAQWVNLYLGLEKLIKGAVETIKADLLRKYNEALSALSTEGTPIQRNTD